jgi:hypothetical protein
MLPPKFISTKSLITKEPPQRLFRPALLVTQSSRSFDWVHAPKVRSSRSAASVCEPELPLTPTLSPSDGERVGVRGRSLTKTINNKNETKNEH